MKRNVYEYISKQTNQPIIEWRTCKRTGEEFPIYKLQKDLEDKFGITRKQDLSPKAMMIKMMMFRNERKLYKTICDLSHKNIISIYHPEIQKNILIYEAGLRSNEEFSNIYKDINYNNIFTDFSDLFYKIPKQSLTLLENENCNFANYVTKCKNVYLSSLVYRGAENVYYSYLVRGGKTVVNSSFVRDDAELVFDSVNVSGGYNIISSVNITNSNDIYFSYDLLGCSNCIFCSNLFNASYCIENKQYTKEEFLIKYNEIKQLMKSFLGYKSLIEKYKEIYNKAFHKNISIVNSENSNGNNIQNCKDVLLSFDSFNVESGLNVRCENTKNALNYIGGESENIVNCARTGWSNSIFGSFNITNSSHIYHSFDINNSHHILFCVGLKNKQYCILNKEYSKEDRQNHFEKIKQIVFDKRGDFLDTNLSIFPYNDTVANDIFPIKENQLTILEPHKTISDAILDLGGEEKLKIKRRTKEFDVTIPTDIETIDNKDLPDNIENVSDSILQKAIICEISGRPFRIVGPELEFYRKHGLCLPHKHPDIRHQEKLEFRPGRELYLRKCDKCSLEMLSIYPEQYEGKVYCEACYNKEIYG